MTPEEGHLFQPPHSSCDRISCTNKPFKMSLEGFWGRKSVRSVYLIYLTWTGTNLALIGQVQPFFWNPVTYSTCQFNSSQCPCFLKCCICHTTEDGYWLWIPDRKYSSVKKILLVLLCSGWCPPLLIFHKLANVTHILISTSQFCHCKASACRLDRDTLMCTQHSSGVKTVSQCIFWR